MPELDRRDFLKVVGLSAGAAVTSACQEPVEKVIPYLVQPEEIVTGSPYYFAPAASAQSAARSTSRREGAIKVDGIRARPIGRGASCVRGQASWRLPTG
jgi:molybdopterin-containing oxidoreductase family iron-sulfur binding subunit